MRSAAPASRAPPPPNSGRRASSPTTRSPAVLDRTGPPRARSLSSARRYYDASRLEEAARDVQRLASRIPARRIPWRGASAAPRFRSAWGIAARRRASVNCWRAGSGHRRRRREIAGDVVRPARPTPCASARPTGNSPPPDRAALEKLETMLRDGRRRATHASPTSRTQLGLGRALRRLPEPLGREGAVAIRVGDGLLYHRDALDGARGPIACAVVGNPPVTQHGRLQGVHGAPSRKFGVPLLESFDRRGLTARRATIASRDRCCARVLTKKSAPSRLLARGAPHRQVERPAGGEDCGADESEASRRQQDIDDDA